MLMWTTNGNDELRHYIISENASISIDDSACMQLDSLCDKPNEWEIQSVCGDSIETEEDISSIPQWISSDEDFWMI